MTAKRLYRIAAVIFVLFAVGHTVGFLTFRPPTAEALTVRDAMNSVHFRVGHATLSYGGFYAGFGLYISAYLLFSALLVWQLSNMASESPRSAAPLGWMLFGLQIVSLVLAMIYFSTPPAALSAIAAACLGLASFKLTRVATV